MMDLKFDCQLIYPSGFELAARFRTTAQVTGITGPSGSGKTTVLRLIAGLIKPTTGSIEFGNRELVHVNGSEKKLVPPEQRRIGMMFQDYCLFPHLNVKKNLMFGSRYRTSESKIDPRQVNEVLNLNDLLDRYPRTLSGGQQQRVALGRALNCSPDLLLLDEPLSSIDRYLRDAITEYLMRVQQEFQVPMILVSHDQALIEKIAERTLTIENGKIETAAGLQERW